MTEQTAAPNASVADVANYFGLSQKTVYRWLASENPPPHVKVGSVYRFRLADVVAWNAERAEEAP